MAVAVKPTMIVLLLQLWEMEHYSRVRIYPGRHISGAETCWLTEETMPRCMKSQGTRSKIAVERMVNKQPCGGIEQWYEDVRKNA